MDLASLFLRPFTPGVLVHTDAGLEEAAVLKALAEAYGTATGTWEPVHRVTVRGALPAMAPPLRLSRTSRFAPGRYVCGDHRATGSLQGALASGARAAREVIAGLGPGAVR